MPTTTMPMGHVHELRLRLEEGGIYAVSGWGGASLRLIGPRLDVDAWVRQKTIVVSGQPGLATIGWVGVIETARFGRVDRRIVGLAVWEDRDAVARAVADELLTIIRESLVPPDAPAAADY